MRLKQRRAQRRLEALAETLRGVVPCAPRWRDHTPGRARDQRRLQSRTHPDRARERRRIQRAHRRAVRQLMTSCRRRPKRLDGASADRLRVPRQRTLPMVLRGARRRCRPLSPPGQVERWRGLQALCEQPGWRARLNAWLQKNHRPRVDDIQRLDGFDLLVAAWPQHWNPHRYRRRQTARPSAPPTPFDAPALGSLDGIEDFIEDLWSARHRPRVFALRSLWGHKYHIFNGLKRPPQLNLIDDPRHHPEWTDAVDDIVWLWMQGVRDVRDLDAALHLFT